MSNTVIQHRHFLNLTGLFGKIKQSIVVQFLATSLMFDAPTPNNFSVGGHFLRCQDMNLVGFSLFKKETRWQVLRILCKQ